jgi:hypothetical protein
MFGPGWWGDRMPFDQLAPPRKYMGAPQVPHGTSGTNSPQGSLGLQSNAVEKGQSGNPLGRLPGEKQFADQLRIVLAEPVDKNDPQSVRKMRRITEKLVECAMNGEGWAISQVADRIDGRPKQESDFNIAPTHRYVIEVPPELSREEWEKKYCPKEPEASR